MTYRSFREKTANWDQDERSYERDRDRTSWLSGEQEGRPEPERYFNPDREPHREPPDESWGAVSTHERHPAYDRGPHYGKGPKGYKRSDARILEDVCEMIAQQGYVDASDVEVTVEASTVTLRGTVGARRDKRELERMVDSVYGVSDIHNEIRLRPDRPYTTRSD